MSKDKSKAADKYSREVGLVGTKIQIRSTVCLKIRAKQQINIAEKLGLLVLRSRSGQLYV